MKKIIGLFLLVAVILTNCKKKDETTDNSNISTQVVANLNQVVAGYSPASLTSTSSQSLTQKSSLCTGKTWEVCQSLLVREYLKIGKSTVTQLSSLVGAVGGSLGNLTDGSSGTSGDGKISWLKTDAANWKIVMRGVNNSSVAYLSIANNVYTLQMDGTASETEPSNFKADVIVTYTDADNWDVDLFFNGEDCDPTDIGSPSKVQIKMTKSSGLWSGRAMLYIPRWQLPDNSITCSTVAGSSEIAMYTDFVGNDISTKAALYLIPATDTTFATASANFELSDFCTNFSSYCSAASMGALTSFANPWCTTGPTATPLWGDSCSANASVSAASFSASPWTTPATLKTKGVTLPTAL